jgi:hypothetical protein
LFSIAAGEAPADIRAFFVDAAAPPHQEFAAVIDFQAVPAVERDLQTTGPQGLEAFILFPADLDRSKGAAAGSAAFTAAIISILGCVEKDSVELFLREVGKGIVALLFAGARR